MCGDLAQVALARWAEVHGMAEAGGCGSSEVTVRTTNYRDHLYRYECDLYRYECEECGRWFTDTSGTFIESANVDLPVWVYVIREMDKDCSINSIAKDLSHT